MVYSGRLALKRRACSSMGAFRGHFHLARIEPPLVHCRLRCLLHAANAVESSGAAFRMLALSEWRGLCNVEVHRGEQTVADKRQKSAP